MTCPAALAAEKNMKTIEDIHSEVNRVKPVTRRQVYRYIKQFHIRPAGARQRPQLYPDDAGQRIVAEFGIKGLVTMKQLRAERRKGGRS